MLDHISDSNKIMLCSMNAMRLKCHGVLFDVSIRNVKEGKVSSNGIRRTFIEKWIATAPVKLICDIVGWMNLWFHTVYAECMLICWCHCDSSVLFFRRLLILFCVCVSEFECVFVCVCVGVIECCLVWSGCNADDCDHVTYNLRLRCFILDVHFGAIIYN